MSNPIIKLFKKNTNIKKNKNIKAYILNLFINHK